MLNEPYMFNRKVMVKLKKNTTTYHLQLSRARQVKIVKNGNYRFAQQKHNCKGRPLNRVLESMKGRGNNTQAARPVRQLGTHQSARNRLTF